MKTRSYSEKSEKANSEGGCEQQQPETKGTIQRERNEKERVVGILRAEEAVVLAPVVAACLEHAPFLLVVHKHDRPQPYQRKKEHSREEGAGGQTRDEDRGSEKEVEKTWKKGKDKSLVRQALAQRHDACVNEIPRGSTKVN